MTTHLSYNCVKVAKYASEIAIRIAIQCFRSGLLTKQTAYSLQRECFGAPVLLQSDVSMKILLILNVFSRSGIGILMTNWYFW